MIEMNLIIKSLKFIIELYFGNIQFIENALFIIDMRASGINILL